MIEVKLQTSNFEILMWLPGNLCSITTIFQTIYFAKISKMRKPLRNEKPF